MTRNTRLALGAVALALTVAVPAAGQSGPNYRPGAPFRAKLSPPLADGTVVVVRGHVRDSAGRPIAGAVIDAFQADAAGRYHNDDFDYRARVTVDEDGYYELETIVPSNYGPPPHIHMVVEARGHATLRTEMMFKDAEHPTNDHPELTPELVERSRGSKKWLEATFDIVLR